MATVRVAVCIIVLECVLSSGFAISAKSTGKDVNNEQLTDGLSQSSARSRRGLRSIPKANTTRTSKGDVTATPVDITTSPIAVTTTPAVKDDVYDEGSGSFDIDDVDGLTGNPYPNRDDVDDVNGLIGNPYPNRDNSTNTERPDKSDNDDRWEHQGVSTIDTVTELNPVNNTWKHHASGNHDDDGTRDVDKPCQPKSTPLDVGNEAFDRVNGTLVDTEQNSHILRKVFIVAGVVGGVCFLIMLLNCIQLGVLVHFLTKRHTKVPGSSKTEMPVPEIIVTKETDARSEHTFIEMDTNVTKHDTNDTNVNAIVSDNKSDPDGNNDKGDEPRQTNDVTQEPNTQSEVPEMKGGIADTSAVDDDTQTDTKCADDVEPMTDIGAMTPLDPNADLGRQILTDTSGSDTKDNGFDMPIPSMADFELTNAIGIDMDDETKSLPQTAGLESTSVTVNPDENECTTDVLDFDINSIVPIPEDQHPEISHL